MERADLAEARAESDRKSLSERADEAVALYLLTVAELSRRASSADELAAMLEEETPISPSAIWKRRHPG
jgi:hypothetical protein